MPKAKSPHDKFVDRAARALAEYVADGEIAPNNFKPEVEVVLVELRRVINKVFDLNISLTGKLDKIDEIIYGAENNS